VALGNEGSARRLRVALGAAIVCVAWASAGVAPLVEAVVEARAPADFTRDFVTAHVRLHGGHLPPAGAEGNAAAVALGAPEVVLLDGPYYLHPPPALFVVMALVPLGFRGAALAWAALTLIALAALAFALVALATRGRPRAVAVVATFGALALWPPVLHDLAKGQWSVLLAALTALGWLALERRRPGRAGTLVGVAACLKLTPALLLVPFARRERRAAVALVGVGAAAAVAALVVNGPALYTAWLVDVPRDVAAWQTWPSNTASLGGLVARWLGGGAFARPLGGAPALARATNGVLSLALLAVAVAATWRRAQSPVGERAAGAAWMLLIVLLNPLAWTHTVVLALPALALLGGIAPPGVLTIALAALSVPRQTLLALAGPPPVSPAAAPLLSLHAFALLALFFVALRAAAPCSVAPAPDNMALPR
jgi:hypothetical protein